MIDVVARGVDEQTVRYASPETARWATVELLGAPRLRAPDGVRYRRPMSYRVAFSDGRVIAGECGDRVAHHAAYRFVRG